MAYCIQRQRGKDSAPGTGLFHIGKQKGVKFVFPLAAVDIHKRICIGKHFLGTLAVIFQLAL